MMHQLISKTNTAHSIMKIYMSGRVTFCCNIAWRVINIAGSFDYHIFTIELEGAEGLQNTEIIREAVGIKILTKKNIGMMMVHNVGI
jgi:hypothetical protein